jgi:transposase InsO family protein
MVKILVEQHNLPLKLALNLLDLPRSTYYYRCQRKDESQLETDLDEVTGQFPTYGTRRITQQLRRGPYRHAVGRKRIRRLMRQKGLLRPVKRRKSRSTDSDHPYPRYPNLVKDLEISYPDQVWVCDITYIRLGRGFVYLAIVMDVFTRAIRGWCLSRLLAQDLTLEALRTALADRVPEIHHSDQGVHYAAHTYIDLLKDHSIQISMAAVGKAEENGYAERFMRTIKEEEVDLSEYQNFAEAVSQISRFIEDVYNEKRIHSSLGYLTPLEFEAVWSRSRIEGHSPSC